LFALFRYAPYASQYKKSQNNLFTPKRKEAKENGVYIIFYFTSGMGELEREKNYIGLICLVL